MTAEKWRRTEKKVKDGSLKEKPGGRRVRWGGAEHGEKERGYGKVW
jgi:hypothetical protein